MLAQVSYDLPSETSSNFSSNIFSSDATTCPRDATPLPPSGANPPHGAPIPVTTATSKSSQKESAKVQKLSKASSIVSKNGMPSDAQRKTSKSYPKGSKSDAQRRPVSSGCSRSRSKQPRAHTDTRSRPVSSGCSRSRSTQPKARRGPTLRSRLWAEAHNPPSSRSTTSVPVSSSSHSSSSSSPCEASPPPPHASSTPSLHEITSTLRSAFDSYLDLVQVQEARISAQQAQISDLQRRLSTLENCPSPTHSGEQHVQDSIRTPPAPSPCSDQRGPTPPTTCSIAVQAGFTTSTFECTLDGTSATSPATSLPDTCDSSTQVRYTRLPVPKVKDTKTSQAMQTDTTVGPSIAIQTNPHDILKMDEWIRGRCDHCVHPDDCTVNKPCKARHAAPYKYLVPNGIQGFEYPPKSAFYCFSW